MKLIPYICCGDPDREFTMGLIRTLAPYSHMIELGIPFSDPVCDGKTIQDASTRALKNGASINTAFSIAKSARGTSRLVFMTYYNLVHQFGARSFLRKAAKSGVEAVIIPDLLFGEDREFGAVAEEEGIKVICMIAPNTGLSRARLMLRQPAPFAYLVSASGTTGARGRVAGESISFVRRIRAVARGKELFVGFGISSREQADKYVAAGADGVVIGSRIIDIYSKSIGQGRGVALEKVERFAKSFK